MKKLTLLALLATLGWSMDFSQMPIEQLISLKGKISSSDMPAFREEMQKRMKDLSPLERMKLMKGAQSQNSGSNSMPWQNQHSQSPSMNQYGRSNTSTQGYGKNRSQQRANYAQYDKNQDNRITQQEFYQAQSERMNQRASEGRGMKHANNAPSFETLDTNHDGVISQREFSEYQQNKMRQRQQNRTMY